jgi:hypothetical protein
VANGGACQTLAVCVSRRTISIADTGTADSVIKVVVGCAGCTDQSVATRGTDVTI